MIQCYNPIDHIAIMKDRVVLLVDMMEQLQVHSTLLKGMAQLSMFSTKNLSLEMLKIMKKLIASFSFLTLMYNQH